MTYFHILLILSNCTLKQKLLATCYILGVSGHLVQKINCDCKFADMRSLCSDTNDLLPHITDIEQLYIKTKIACNTFKQKMLATCFL
jgi:hypothetical protein